VGAVALRQPMLRVGVVGPAALRPAFVRAPEIDLARVVVDGAPGDGVRARSREEDDEAVMGAMARMQDAVLDAADSAVLWRVTVLRPAGAEQWDDGGDDDDASDAAAAAATTTTDTNFVDVIFTFHHAIGDGMSGVIFHETLRDVLNGPASALPHLGGASGCVLALPDPPPAVPTIHGLVPFTTSWGYLLTQVWNSMFPSWMRLGPREPEWWSITRVDPDLPYATTLRQRVLPGRVSSALARAAKAHDVGVAALLNALVAASAARRMPDHILAAHPHMVVRGDTTINLRPWMDPAAVPPDTPPPAKLITGANSSYTVDFGPDEIADFRSVSAHTPTYPPTAPADPSLLDDLIWRSARAVMVVQRARLATLPHNDYRALLKYVRDIRPVVDQRMTKGGPRAGTYEVGSLGAVDPHSPPPPDGAPSSQKHALRRLAFANPSQPQSAALMLNAAGVRGGDLSLILSFGHGHLSVPFADDVLADIARWATALADSGSFGV
jgi:hypothetical protein